MALARLIPPAPFNEPVLTYAPHSSERAQLKAALSTCLSTEFALPLWIDGQKVHTGTTQKLTVPHDHAHNLGCFHVADVQEINQAIAAAQAAKSAWAALPWEERAAIFLRAASLLQTEFRERINAATMIGQSKTAHQAEIDAACELIDFFRFNVAYLAEIYSQQPHSPPGTWNHMEYRPLDGFVLAVTPFNFTSIAGNLPTAPALCGNTVVWKPASTAVLSGAVIMELLMAAGLPPGVINFVPCSGKTLGEVVLSHPELAGIHFTGSTAVFQHMWKQVGQNIDRYRSYPRVVGETGGKDFVFAHASADLSSLTHHLLRGAFEYQGQKCSAASRAYIPRSLWPQLRARLADQMATFRVGNICDFRNFMGAVIDQPSFHKLQTTIDAARHHLGTEVEEVLGGQCDAREGYFIHPTLIVAKNPHYRTMEEELFGPVLTLFVYEDSAYEETLRICDQTSNYGLTGAIFATERAAIHQAYEGLRYAAGNFYINDKPTGAVVGQQPFGGSRASGTNDKAGSMLNLLRWMSPRTIKENFIHLRDYRYPFMDEA